MVRRLAHVSSVLAVVASLVLPRPALAVELRDPQASHLALTFPDAWTVATDGAYVELPRYWSVTTLTPGVSASLSTTML